MFQWFIVLIYVAALFVFAGDEVSSAAVTGRFLAELLPHLGAAQIKRYVVIVRKLGHFFAYALLAFLVYRAALQTKKLHRAALPCAAVFALAVAVADEAYQRFLVHRTGAWTDVFIDGAGIVLVVFTIVLQTKRKEKTNLEVMEDVKDEFN